jgi:hypothetical protein
MTAASKSTRRCTKLALAGSLLVHLLGCSAGPARTIEYFDDVTAATITGTAEPTVFARERSELASHARDYVALSALAINRGGRIEYVLLVYRWSTVDPRLQPAGTVDEENLLLAVDDRVLRLEPDGRTLRQAGTSIALHSPRQSAAQPRLYRADPALLHALGESRTLNLLTPRADPGGAFVMWRDARLAFSQLAQRP